MKSEPLKTVAATEGNAGSQLVSGRKGQGRASEPVKLSRDGRRSNKWNGSDDGASKRGSTSPSSYLSSSNVGYSSARPFSAEDISTGTGSAVAASSSVGGDAPGDSLLLTSSGKGMTTNVVVLDEGEAGVLESRKRHNEALRARVVATVAEVAAETCPTDLAREGFSADKSSSIVAEKEALASSMASSSGNDNGLPPMTRSSSSRRQSSPLPCKAQVRLGCVEFDSGDGLTDAAVAVIAPARRRSRSRSNQVIGAEGNSGEGLGRSRSLLLDSRSRSPLAVPHIGGSKRRGRSRHRNEHGHGRRSSGLGETGRIDAAPGWEADKSSSDAFSHWLPMTHSKSLSAPRRVQGERESTESSEVDSSSGVRSLLVPLQSSQRENQRRGHEHCDFISAESGSTLERVSSCGSKSEMLLLPLSNVHSGISEDGGGGKGVGLQPLRSRSVGDDESSVGCGVEDKEALQGRGEGLRVQWHPPSSKGAREPFLRSVDVHASHRAEVKTNQPRQVQSQQKNRQQQRKTIGKRLTVVRDPPAAVDTGPPGLRSTHFAPGYLGVAWPDPLESVAGRGGVRGRDSGAMRTRILARLEEAAARKVADVEEKARKAQRDRVEKLRRRQVCFFMSSSIIV